MATLSILPSIRGADVKFFEHVLFQGESVLVSIHHSNQCVNLGPHLSSIDTYGREIIGYPSSDCEGSAFSIPNSCHDDFRKCDLNDKVLSIKLLF